MKLFRNMMLVFAVLALVLGAVSAQDMSVIRTSRQMGPDDIPTLDPSVASDVPSVQVITEIFPELGRLHEEDVVVQPGMATWEISEDGLTYTFSIMQEVSWVKYNADSGEVEQVMVDGSPRYVMAQDFATGMVRTLDPVVASDYSYVLAPWVTGASEFNASEADADEDARAALIDGLGVTLVDDYTLEVSVTRASAALESIFAMWITTAQPGWLIEDKGDLWIEAENIVSYGPFAIKEWNHGENLTMVKNPFWTGTDSIPAPQVDAVEFVFLDDGPGLASFEAGELDVSEAPALELDRIRADESLSVAYSTVPGSCTYYYGFNKERAPFDDARAVKAFSMAIERSAITENITGAGELPAGFFTLRSMVAAPLQEDYPEFAVLTDIDAAVALWDEYLADTGQAPENFSLTLLHNNNDTHAAIAQAIQQMWVNNLGVEVQISSQEFGTYLDQRREADIYRAGWCFDYPDANNWLFDVFYSSNDPDNHFANAEYDALVEQAAVAPTVDERRDLYAQAENILVNTDASIAPIYYYVGDQMTAAGLDRTFSVITREYYEKWSFSG